MSPITFHNFLLLVKAIDMLSLMYFWKPEYFTDDTTINNINFKNNIGEKSAMQNNHVISRILPTAFISLTLRFRCVNINYLYPTDLLKVEANSSYSRNSYFSIWNAPSIQDIHTGVAVIYRTMCFSEDGVQEEYLWCAVMSWVLIHRTRLR